MFSIIYTPTEGDAIQNYSSLFRKPQGCFLNIHDIDRVHNDLAQWGSPDDIDYIVVTGLSSLLHKYHASLKTSR
jgi:malate dehydrogenase (oxaloacetate-decarboxylating)